MKEPLIIRFSDKYCLAIGVKEPSFEFTDINVFPISNMVTTDYIAKKTKYPFIYTVKIDNKN